MQRKFRNSLWKTKALAVVCCVQCRTFLLLSTIIFEALAVVCCVQFLNQFLFQLWYAVNWMVRTRKIIENKNEMKVQMCVAKMGKLLYNIVMPMENTDKKLDLDWHQLRYAACIRQWTRECTSCGTPNQVFRHIQPIYEM